MQREAFRPMPRCGPWFPAYSPPGRCGRAGRGARRLRRAMAQPRRSPQREDHMADTLPVHDPRGYPPKVTGKRLANRPQSLDGKTLYLVDCLFDNSEAFIDQLRRWFAEHLPAVNTRTIKPRE